MFLNSQINLHRSTKAYLQQNFSLRQHGSDSIVRLRYRKLHWGNNVIGGRERAKTSPAGSTTPIKSFKMVQIDWSRFRLPCRWLTS